MLPLSTGPDAGETEAESSDRVGVLSLKEATDREKQRMAAVFVGALTNSDDKDSKGPHIGSNVLATSQLLDINRYHSRYTLLYIRTVYYPQISQ